jgi:hypothetical protein
MKTWLIALGCISIFSLSAQAQDAPAPSGGGGPSPRQACKADYQKLCSGAQQGGAKACMNEHKDELSQPCKDAIARRAADKGNGGPEQSAPPPPKQ